MTRHEIDGQPIEIGYEWRQILRINSDPAAFPSGVQLTSHVRLKRSSSAILATLSIANGRLLRRADNEIEIVMPAVVTAAMTVGTVILDIARTDAATPQLLGFAMTIPVQMPVTRL